MEISLIIFLNTILFISAYWCAYKNTALVVPWIIVFTCIWTIPTGVIWFNSGISSIDYTFKIFSNISLPDVGDIEINHLVLICLVSSFCMLIASIISNKLYKPSNKLIIKPFNKLDLTIVFAAWCVITLTIIAFNSLPWHFVFLPVYAEKNIYINYIFRSFYLYLPVLAAFFCLASSKRKKTTYLVLFWCFLTSFSTGQRRDLLSLALILTYYVSYFKYGRVSLGKFISFKKAILLLAVGLSAVVLFWCTRVIFTNYVVTGEIVDPFKVRSFWDVLFGSAATGMPTLYITNEYVKVNSVQYFYDILYGLVQFIPRGIWDSKPIGIDTVIQNWFSMEDSPSPFWYGDFTFSFGIYLLPIVSLVFGFFFTLFQNCLISSNKSVSIILSGFFFSNMFTLYKNGLGTYLAVVINSTLVVLVLLSFSILIKNILSKK